MVGLVAMKIFVKAADGKTITFDVEPSDLVAQVKDEVSKKLGVAISKQVMVVHDEETMKDHLPLHTYGVHAGTVIQLRVKDQPAGPMVSGAGQLPGPPDFPTRSSLKDTPHNILQKLSSDEYKHFSELLNNDAEPPTH